MAASIVVRYITHTAIHFTCSTCGEASVEFTTEDAQLEWFQFGCPTCDAQRKVNLCRVVAPRDVQQL